MLSVVWDNFREIVNNYVVLGIAKYLYASF